MITTSDPELADRARMIRNQGMRARYEHELVGINERMTEIEAAIGLVQLQKLEGWTKRRRENAAWYSDHLDPALNLPVESPNALHVYHQYTIRPAAREEAVVRLEQAGIGYGIYYPKPTHHQDPYLSLGVSLPTTEALALEVLSIPIRPDLTTTELEQVAAALNGGSR
jgi:dTDP-4-amino-4,6-dideoxygalactose transaminase